MKTLIKDNFLLILLSFLFFILGIFTYKDYGVGIEEHFQRKSGFYWLNYLLNSFGTETFRETALLKYNEILTFTPNLFDIKIFKRRWLSSGVFHLFTIRLKLFSI